MTRETLKVYLIGLLVAFVVSSFVYGVSSVREGKERKCVMDEGDEQVLVSKKELVKLRDRELFLIALEQSGVDNWDGYAEAQDLYFELKGE